KPAPGRTSRRCCAATSGSAPRSAGAPAYDPDFNVADLYVLLSLRRTDPRYLRHFLSLAPLR
ncbi:hypothetical protein GA0115255_126331, partial [Streptomyces sp. Ncost-T6T-2b]